ncbi:MAG: hypothetical protein HY580_06540 [Nitrospinae bacterium]|nr:hypothetical protein [Nitrospinota bacterium]
MTAHNGSAAQTGPAGGSKFRQAGYGFFALNMIYLVLIYVFLPPFNLGAKGFLYAGIYALFMAALAYFVCRGFRKVALVLAVIYGLRSVVSLYTMIRGEAFMAVPYVLPCLIITFYVLARAVWDWP